MRDMKQAWQGSYVLMLAAATLVACGDNDGSSAVAESTDDRDAIVEQIDQLCLEIAGEGAPSKAGCVDCLLDVENATDGDVRSATTVYVDPESGAASVGVRSQPGLVYPAGYKATVLVSGGELAGDLDVTLTTSFEGKLVSSECILLRSDEDLALSPVTVTSAGQFDGVEISVVSSGGGQCGDLTSGLTDASESIVSLDVHEFCATYGSGL